MRDVRAGAGAVEEAAVAADAGQDVVELADVDLAAEHRSGGGPQEGDEAPAANVPRPALMSVTVARLRNWRRLTPMPPRVGGDPDDRGGATRATTRLCSRASTAARSTSLAAWARGPSISASLSRRRVSRLSAPAPRTSLLRAAVSSTTANSTHEDGDGDGDDGSGTHDSSCLTVRRRCRHATGA